MVRATLSALILLSLIVPFPSAGEDMLVYVAHQDWPSRIYLLSTDGSVIRYFEYDFTRLCDIEVVGNELYVVRPARSGSI